MAILEALKGYNGTIEYQGKEYQNYEAFRGDFKPLNDNFSIILHPHTNKGENEPSGALEEHIKESQTTSNLEITVKAYMTRKATPDFDFMEKWNNNKPMPMRVMVGRKIKETKGMVYMELEGTGKPTINCYCCGKELTNPVSRHYGIGPVCLSKIGIQRDINDIEGIKEELSHIKWEGWIIKSAIIEEKEV